MFDILAVLKVMIAVGMIGIAAAVAGIVYFKLEQKKHRHNAS